MTNLRLYLTSEDTCSEVDDANVHNVNIASETPSLHKDVSVMEIPCNEPRFSA